VRDRGGDVETRVGRMIKELPALRSKLVQGRQARGRRDPRGSLADQRGTAAFLAGDQQPGVLRAPEPRDRPRRTSVLVNRLRPLAVLRLAPRRHRACLCRRTAAPGRRLPAAARAGRLRQLGTGSALAVPRGPGPVGRPDPATGSTAPRPRRSPAPLIDHEAGCATSRSWMTGARARNARPRWEIACFSADDISAVVRSLPSGRKIGS
jgi:hypothetical protein